jgi:hypothetical protein
MNSLPRFELADLIRSLEPPYQSRGEAQVGRVLDAYGIPFFYDQPTLIYDRGHHHIWHPGFTLPSYNGLVVEYADMMDVPGYARGIEHKRQTYAQNAIPAVFVYPEQVTAPDWPEDLTRRIEQAGYQSMGNYAAAQRRPYQ